LASAKNGIKCWIKGNFVATENLFQIKKAFS